MRRLRWPLALVVAFALGLTAGVVVGKPSSAVRELDRLRETVSRLQHQVTTLQARLRARESVAGVRQPGAPAPAEAPQGTSARAATRPSDGIAAATATTERAVLDRLAQERAAARPRAGAQAEGTASRPGSRAADAPAPTVAQALDRFYRYLEAINAQDGRGRGRQARELVEELRAMGDVAGQALMQVLTAGNDSDERRTAARLLGSLQVPQSLPVLRDIIEKDDDVLLRRAAAYGLRRLQTPESLPVMERMVLNPDEDRFVRLSAAYGLAQSGRPLGVGGLAQIFEESTADGRGREIAFRALASLNDERSLPFMRLLVTSPVEPAYRLQAIRYLTAQGDRQALAALQLVMQSPTEQPSVRDAAARAHAILGGR